MDEKYGLQNMAGKTWMVKYEVYGWFVSMRCYVTPGSNNVTMCSISRRITVTYLAQSQ